MTKRSAHRAGSRHHRAGARWQAKDGEVALTLPLSNRTAAVLRALPLGGTGAACWAGNTLPTAGATCGKRVGAAQAIGTVAAAADLGAIHNQG